MAKTARSRLTEVRVRTATDDDAKHGRQLFDGLGSNGLYLHVTPAGAKCRVQQLIVPNAATGKSRACGSAGQRHPPRKSFVPAQRRADGDGDARGPGDPWMLIGLAADWTDRWWERPLGPHAFVVESELAHAGAADPDDVTRVVGLTKSAWCMERAMHVGGRAIPDVTTAFAPDGLVPANIHPEPLRDAMRGQRQSIIKRMATPPEPMKSATCAHVQMHLDGSAVRPWSLPERRSCGDNLHVSGCTCAVRYWR